MTRFDRAILWLADRVHLAYVILVPPMLAWIAMWWRLEHHIGGRWSYLAFAIEIAGGGLMGHLAARWEIRWFRRQGIHRCYDCRRIGRWSIRITTLPDDSLAIPEPPPSHAIGCWCQKHATDHLLRFMWTPLQAIYSEVALVPYDRNGGRLVNEERQRRDA